MKYLNSMATKMRTVIAKVGICRRGVASACLVAFVLTIFSVACGSSSSLGTETDVTLETESSNSDTDSKVEASDAGENESTSATETSSTKEEDETESSSENSEDTPTTSSESGDNDSESTSSDAEDEDSVESSTESATTDGSTSDSTAESDSSTDEESTTDLPEPTFSLIVDEIPGGGVGGRILHLDADGNTITEITSLRMPYDIEFLPDEQRYLVGTIRDRAVLTVTMSGETEKRIEVGGYPCSVRYLETDTILVAGWDNGVPGFVKEFDREGEVLWEVTGLKWPWRAQRLDSGNTLIGDAGTNRVFEVDPDGKEVWAVEDLGPSSPQTFDRLGPVDVQRLEGGNTLVSVRGLNKVIEIDPKGEVIWEMDSLSRPYSAVRLPNGNTLISEQGKRRVIEVNPDKQVVWEKGGFGYLAKAYRIPPTF